MDLLNLTICDAWHIGGPDNADGIVIVHHHEQSKSSVLYPVEIKSFKPKNKNKVCRIKEHEDQIKRYLGGYTSDTITRLYSVKSLLMISYDFDLTNETDTNVIKKIKSEFGVDIILMPLKSLIRIV